MRKTFPFQLIHGMLYKLGHDEVLRQCVLEHEMESILREAHEEVASRHHGLKALHKKLCWLAYGGPHYSKMQKNR